MSIPGSAKVHSVISSAPSSAGKQADLKSLFETFKQIKADKTLPEPLRTQQLRQHAALIYSKLNSKSQMRVRP